MPRVIITIYIFYLILRKTEPDMTFCDLSCLVENKVVRPTVCRNYPCHLGKSCDKGTEARLTPSEEKLITNLHNYYRHRTASGHLKINLSVRASNMQALVYDRELSYSAQCHTNSCSMDYDPCGITPKYKEIGQNIFTFNGIMRASKINKAIKEWFKEIGHLNLRIIKNYTVGSYFSLTQLVWARTKYIGCGRTINGHKTLFACYYSPPGNVPGEPVFEVGLPCSNCFPNSKCDKGKKALCMEDFGLVPLNEFSGVEKINTHVFFIVLTVFCEYIFLL